MVKKKKNEILEDLGPTFTLAGGSLGASVLGGAFNTLLPAVTPNPLTTTGRVTSTFVAPLATLGAMSFVTRKLKKIEKKLKGGKKK